MSATIQDNKIILSTEIDLSSILEKVENEPSDSFYSVRREVVNTANQEIIEHLKGEIMEKLNTPHLINSIDWNKYISNIETSIDEMINKIIEDKVNNAISVYTKDGVWSKSKIDQIVQKRIDDHFESSIIPMVQDIIKSLVVFNENRVQDWISEAGNTGYEAGRDH
jgi:hypothetical protein